MRRLIRRKNKWTAPLLALLLILALGGWVIGYYVRDEYRTYKSDLVSEYEETETEWGDYALITEKKVVLGKTYAGFSIVRRESKEMVYRCPELYPVGNLASIDWEEGDVLVRQKDGAVKRYRRLGERWEISKEQANDGGGLNIPPA